MEILPGLNFKFLDADLLAAFKILKWDFKYLKKKILNTRDSFFLILESQMSPHVMYGSAWCKWILKLSRGKVSHMYNCAGEPQYTMLVFGFSGLHTRRQNKEEY